MKTKADQATVRLCIYCGDLSHEAKEPSITCIEYLKREHAALLAVEKAGNRLQLESIHFRDNKIGVQHLNAAIDAYSQASINLATLRGR